VGQSIDKDVAVFYELGEEYFVPEIHELRAATR
jgi:hypothetical protein